jgi:glycosyltransferase involved in cell wall biosynthesis
LIKLILGTVPKAGGTFTFYRNLRSSIRRYGIDVICLTVGKRENTLKEEKFVDEGCVSLATHTNNVKQQALAVVTWVSENDIDVVIALNSVAILSAIPHFDTHVKIISRVASIFEEGYRSVIYGYDRLSCIVATAPRHGRDLVELYGVDASKLVCIPNAVDIPKFSNLRCNVKKHGKNTLQLGFLGRFDHFAKGVLFLIPIVEQLDLLDVQYVLSIAGGGRYEQQLHREFSMHIQTGKIRMVGSLEPDEIPDYLNKIDVLLFPSKYEGCPNTLIEAVASGCVPIVWRIDGITDFIVKHENTGFVCDLGDMRGFANYIAILGSDPDLMQEMSRNASDDAANRFSTINMAKAYSKVIYLAHEEGLSSVLPVSWSEFQVIPAYQEKRWKMLLPEYVFRLLRSVKQFFTLKFS